MAFSEVVGKAGQGAQTVEDWWARFSTLSSPSLSPELILAGRADEAARLIQILQEETRLTLVSGPSLDDVLAFVAASMMSTATPQRDELLERTLIVRDAVTLRRLDLGEGLLILLPFEEDLRREAQLVRAHHVVLLCEDGGSADIPLPPIDPSVFEALLRDRSVEETRAQELARAARRSLGAFQRRASSPRAAATPQWASLLGSKVTRRAWLAGRWNERRSGDTDALAALFDAPYAEVRDDLSSLAGGPDPLFVTVGDTWAIADFEETWRYGHPVLQSSDLAAFEVLLQTVLAAVDPKLALPIADRWMAAVYGKSRVHSSDLRQGVAEVLAVLSARGETVSVGSETIRSWLHRVLGRLFRRANEDEAGQLWASLTDVLPLIGEAGPDVFLQAVQTGLDGNHPLLGAMFADSEEGSFSVSSPHTGLLWALETVAWSPEHFGLAVEQLARLAEVDPGGRLSNRPAASLAAIFRPWMPQASISGDRRMTVLDALRRRHNAVSWPLMLAMLPEFRMVGHFTSSPKYRSWKPESNRTIPRDQRDVEIAVSRRLVEDAETDPDRWAELVGRLDDIPEEVLSELVHRLNDLSGEASGAAIRTRAWEPLRDLVQRHQRFSYAEWAMSAERIELLDALQQRLAPEDIVDRVRWLFNDHTPDLPEQNDPEFDFEQYMAAVADRRSQALIALSSGDGALPNLLRLARECVYPWFVGSTVGEAGLDEVGAVLLEQIDSDDPNLVAAACGWTRQQGKANGWAWTNTRADALSARPVAKARVLLESDELEQAWTVAAQDRAVDAAYWSEFSPYGRGQGFALAEQAAGRLLEHDRPRAALMLINLYLGSAAIDRELVLQGLEHLVRTPEDHPDQFRVDSHEIERLLDYLRKGDVDEERLGLLEWRLRPALWFDAHSPVLERRLGRDPAFFVEVLSMAFRPRNLDPEREVPPNAASNAYQLLNDWNVVPGSAGPKTPVDPSALSRWINEVGPLVAEADRVEIGYDIVGRVLAKAPADDDGTWPTRPVRDLIERMARPEIDDGFRIEVYNSRGVTTRGLTDGGRQERELSAHYADLADRVCDEWPRTGAILRSLAEGYADQAHRHDEDAERFREGLA